MTGALRKELVTLSRDLGEPARRLAILGEGNTSVSCGEGTFWIKASGTSLSTLTENDVSRVRLEPILSLLERRHLDELETETALRDSLVDRDQKKPSVETFLHAVCQHEAGATWVAHTHPVSVNRILCSRRGAEPFRRHVFPDAVVVCGRTPAIVPYVDPGFELAKAVQRELRRYRAEHGKAPRVLLMESHGAVALGATAKDASNIMTMLDKWADVLWGALAMGGPRWLADGDVARIDERLDEEYRRKQLLEPPP